MAVSERDHGSRGHRACVAHGGQYTRLPIARWHAGAVVAGPSSWADRMLDRIGLTVLLAGMLLLVLLPPLLVAAGYWAAS